MAPCPGCVACGCHLCGAATELRCGECLRRACSAACMQRCRAGQCALGEHVALLLEVVRISKTAPLRRTAADSLAQAAAVFLAHGKSRAAETVAEAGMELIQDVEHCAQFTTLLAEAALARGDTDLAVAALDAFKERYPDHVPRSNLARLRISTPCVLVAAMRGNRELARTILTSWAEPVRQKLACGSETLRAMARFCMYATEACARLKEVEETRRWAANVGRIHVSAMDVADAGVTARTLMHMAHVLYHCEDLAEAAMAAREAERRLVQLYGIYHHHVASCLHLRAVILHDQGRVDDALRLGARACVSMRVSMGEQHYETRGYVKQWRA